MLDPKRLRYVTTLAAQRNYARAAEELRISQPALTRSIQAIEQELGVQLFERGRRSVEATSFGRLLVAHSRNVEAAMENLRRDLAVAKGELPGKLSIGAGLWGGSSLVGPALGRLTQRLPGVRINLLLAPWHELSDKLRQGAIDVMIGYVDEMAGDDEFDVAGLSLHRGYIVCRPGHPLTELAAPGPSDIFGYPFAGPELPGSVLSTLGKLSKETRAAWKRSGGLLPVRCDSASALKSIVMQSDVVTSMSVFMVAGEVHRGELVLLLQPDLGLHGRYGVAWSRGRLRSSAAELFVEILLAHDRELLEQERQVLATLERADRAKGEPRASPARPLPAETAKWHPPVNGSPVSAHKRRLARGR